MHCSVPQLLRPYIEALNEDGYSAQHLEFDAYQMDEVRLKRAQSDHKVDMKAVPRELRTAFDASELPKATPGEKYYCGWLVSGIPTTKAMLAAGLLVKLIVSDFAHAKKQADGFYAFAVGFDANGHIVPVAAMHTIKPESKDSWEYLIAAMKVCPRWRARVSVCMYSLTVDPRSPNTSGILRPPHRCSRSCAHF